MLSFTKILAKTEDPPRGAWRSETNPDNRSLRELLLDDRLAAPRPADSRRNSLPEAHLHGAALCIFWAFVLGLSALGLVWLYHMVMPEKYCFLSDVQESKLDAVLLSSVTTLLIADRTRRLFKS